jgi:CheY-like chemotaxis protein
MSGTLDSGRKTTILLVEDDDGVQEAMREILEDEGYQVELARHGREALERLAALPQPCLVLLDLMMPEMTGSEFLDAARARGLLREIPVVLMTGSRIYEMPVGASALLRKPMSLRELRSLIARHCGTASAAGGS